MRYLPIKKKIVSQKYSQVERERKYLIASDRLDFSGLSSKRITDRYIVDSCMRLRQVVDQNGIVYKLTKKVAQTGQYPGKYTITTIYLNEKEYTQLLVLQGVQVSKTRYILEEGGVRIAIDQYQQIGQQILIAEVEFASDEEMHNFQMRIPYLKEITGENEFDGYELAKRFGDKVKV
jgi:CYTH domain-containing protein